MVNFKKLSKAGSISIPVGMRREFGIQEGDSFEIVMNNDGSILAKRHVAHCIFCEGTENVEMFKGKPICKGCKAEIGGIQ